MNQKVAELAKSGDPKIMVRREGRRGKRNGMGMDWGALVPVRAHTH